MVGRARLQLEFAIAYACVGVRKERFSFAGVRRMWVPNISWSSCCFRTRMTCADPALRQTKRRIEPVGKIFTLEYPFSLSSVDSTNAGLAMTAVLPCPCDRTAAPYPGFAVSPAARSCAPLRGKPAISRPSKRTCSRSTPLSCHGWQA